MKYNFQDVDQRMVKTRIALIGAIFNLIKEEKKIKVLDICHEADITPITYYHHFGNKQQLLKFAIEDQLVGILPIPAKLKPINLKHLIYYLVCAFNSFIHKHKELIYSLINQNGKNWYYEFYVNYIFKTIKQLVKQEIQFLQLENSFYIDFWTNIICGSLWNIFNQILVNNQTYSNEKIWLSIKTLLSCINTN